MKLAINTKLINKNKNNDRAAMAHGFENHDMSPKELAVLINRGYAFCPQVKDGHRKSKNFICSDYIAVDIDEGWTVEEALAEDFVKTQASILYKTASHTPDEHRFRIVFELPRTITDPVEMTHAMAGIGRKFRGDPVTTDAARLFFGSHNSKPMVFGNVLDVKNLNEIIELGQGDKHVSDSEVARPGHSAVIRSKIRIAPNLLIRDSTGKQLTLNEWPPKTSIYCPVHLDKNPSAFTVRGSTGGAGIHCSTCNSTFWSSDKPPPSYNFYFFDSTIKEMEAEEQEEFALDEGDIVKVLAQTRSFMTINEDKFSGTSLKQGLTLIKSPKNTGKTHYLEHVIKECQRRRLSVLLIGHRQSLLKANAKRLGMDCYLDLRRNELGGWLTGNKLAISVDGLPTYLRGKNKKFKVVIIDESEQVLSHIIADTLNERRRMCYLLLQRYIANASTVIALDADMNRITVEGILNCLPPGRKMPLRVILNEVKEEKKQMYLYRSEDHLLVDMMIAIRDGKRCFICCNSKTKVDQLREKFAADFGDDISVFWITSENSHTNEVTTFIENIKTEILNYQVIIVSPAVGTGVDITFPQEAQYVDCVFGLFGPRINTHYDIDQQIYRVRQPKEIRVYISSATFTFETDRTAIARELAESGVVGDALIRFDEDGLPVINMDDPFLDLYANIVSAQRASKNNQLYYFTELRKRNGWEIIEVKPEIDDMLTGYEIRKDAKALHKEKRIRDILSARAIDTHDVVAMIQKRKHTALSRPEQLQLDKAFLNSFYREPVTRELILMDNDGKLRKQISKLVLLLDKSRRMGKLKQDIDIIGMVLDASGVFSLKDKTFDTAKSIDVESLRKFVVTCKKQRVSVERLLNMEVRADIIEKPMAQLNGILKLVGLKALQVDKQRTGETAVYKYRIDVAGYQRMLGFVQMRNSKQKIGEELEQFGDIHS